MYQHDNQSECTNDDDCGCSVCNPCPCGAAPCEERKVAMCVCGERHVMPGAKACWPCNRDWHEFVAECAS